MPEPQTTPREHDKPVFAPQIPNEPSPEDPRQNQPIQDPPIDPEHDDVERVNPVRQATEGDVEGNKVLFDENRTIG